ncbi:MAG: DUF1761 domain-containing protein [Pseudomonadota bacterium]
MLNFLRNVSSQLHADALLAMSLAWAASVLIGLVYYQLLGSAWREASDLSEYEAQSARSMTTLLMAGVCYGLLALALYGVIWHASFGQVSMRASLIAAALCWFGFIVPTMLANHRFQGRLFKLTVINAGHWLVVIFAQAAIIGWVATVQP